MAFSGFSEDDIRKLKHPNLSEQNSSKLPAPSKKATLKNHTRQVDSKFRRNPSNHKITNNLPSVNKSSNLPDSAKLCSVTDGKSGNVTDTNSNVVTENSQNQLEESSPNNGQVVQNSDAPESSQSQTGQYLCSNNLDTKSAQIKTNLEDKDNDSAANASVYNKKSIDLSEFEARQKVIEEQNRKRKELLAKALADRTRQTQEEAQRLNQIQNEFRKLDASLSNDVRILRKQIEVASLDYLDAEKKYNRIEKEYLEAKVLLHQKRERKTMLTEHLCAIIERNEERKAEKLTELLQKLQLGTPLESGDLDSLGSNTSDKPSLKQ